MSATYYTTEYIDSEFLWEESGYDEMYGPAPSRKLIRARKLA